MECLIAIVSIMLNSYIKFIYFCGKNRSRTAIVMGNDSRPLGWVLPGRKAPHFWILGWWNRGEIQGEPWTVQLISRMKYLPRFGKRLY